MSEACCNHETGSCAGPAPLVLPASGNQASHEPCVPTVMRYTIMPSRQKTPAVRAACRSSTEWQLCSCESSFVSNDGVEGDEELSCDGDDCEFLGA